MPQRSGVSAAQLSMVDGLAPQLAQARARAEALSAAGRHADAAELYRQLGLDDQALDARRAQTAARPDSAVAEHNLASLLGDLGQAAEAEASVRRAFRKGGDAPETWLVLARALQSQDRHEEADAAYGQVLSRRPLYVDAVRERAQLVWMRTADAQAALDVVDAATAHAVGQGAQARGPLFAARATLMEYVGAAPEAVAEMLAASGVVGDPRVEMAAAHAALTFDRDRALDHMRAALALAPDAPVIRLKLAEIHLGRGEHDQALALIEPVVQGLPADQNALSLLATAWRASGDPRAHQIVDYATMVRGCLIDTPDGWPSLHAYLADLARSLRGLHRLQAHPVGQSLRHGTQTSVNLKASDDPAIRAFFAAVDRPISEHVRHLGHGGDPLRRRNTGGWRMAGCWSVQLQPNGFHKAHVHSEGWLSSACYIDLPPAVEAGGRQGWIGFGGPPFDCGRPMPPEHYEKPEPGKLVLFPSYMWHGTVPFEGPSTRLTIAFDVVPA